MISAVCSGIMSISHKKNLLSMNLEKLKEIAREIRGRIISNSHKTRMPHLGSCLSCVDILVAVYFHSLKSMQSNSRVDKAKPTDPWDFANRNWNPLMGAPKAFLANRKEWPWSCFVTRISQVNFPYPHYPARRTPRCSENYRHQLTIVWELELLSAPCFLQFRIT